MKKAKKQTLTKEERGLESMIGVSKPLHKSSPAYLATMAAANEAKSQVVTARLNTQDLALLKEQAEQKGLGYQTLLGSILHQYVTGQLVEIREARELLKKLG